MNTIEIEIGGQIVLQIVPDECDSERPQAEETPTPGNVTVVDLVPDLYWR